MVPLQLSDPHRNASLRVLMDSSGQVVNRDQLLTEVWNDEENNE